MDEQGFDFKPVERREPKPFEPPPWERDAFEELQRVQAESEVAEPEDEPEEDRGQTDERGERGEIAGEPASGPGAEIEPEAGAASLDDAQLIEMFAALSAEEPARPEGYFAVAFGAGLILLAIGGVLIVWAMAALVSSRQTGWVGQWSGLGLGMFGAFFVGMGVWMLYRTLKQRGVL